MTGKGSGWNYFHDNEQSIIHGEALDETHRL